MCVNLPDSRADERLFRFVPVLDWFSEQLARLLASRGNTGER